MKRKGQTIMKRQKEIVTKKDIICIFIITTIYAIISFINLGSFTNPQTFWKSEYQGDYATFKIEEVSTDELTIRYYCGNEVGNYDLYFSTDNVEYIYCFSISTDAVYSWRDAYLTNAWQYVKVVGNQEGSYIGELAIKDIYGNLFTLIPMDENAKLILDEQNTVPDEISYLNSTYFDEIYFARTGYEFAHGLSIYEWTHPPLGKLLISIPIKLFGMTTFSYRFMGNLAGILMIPVIFCFAKILFRKTKYGILAASIIAVDGMHFVQTRIATVDSFLTLFVMLEYLFMFKYTKSDDELLKKRICLLFCSGLFMGASICVKWTGVFAGIGLAIIFFAHLARNILVKQQKWNKEHTKIILTCFISFVFVPIVLYILSYLPFYIRGYITDLESFINWQVAMYDYHHNLDEIHPYSSMWYTWPITQKSVFYWVGETSSGLSTKIALLGNPAVFWFSVPCVALTLIMAIKKRKADYINCIIAIVCMLVPYIGITRNMFLYHYFPCLPFVIFNIVAFIKWLCEKMKSDIAIYIAIIVFSIVFFIFYPIYSGFPISIEYLEKLKLLKTWVW